MIVSLPVIGGGGGGRGGALSVFRCFQADEQPLTADTKRPEPAYSSWVLSQFCDGKAKRDAIPSAKCGMKMAERG